LVTGPSGYDNRASDFQLLSALAQRRVLHGLISRPNITTSMMYQIVVCQTGHTKQQMEQGNVVLSDGEDE